MASFLSTRLQNKNGTHRVPFLFWRSHPHIARLGEPNEGTCTDQTIHTPLRATATQTHAEFRFATFGLPSADRNSGWRLQHVLTKRCQPKNPRFSRVFFASCRFSHFFEIRILAKIKRCQSVVLGKGVEVNLYRAFLGEIFAIFHRRYLPFFIIFKKLC